jgi:hypothetical protein
MSEQKLSVTMTAAEVEAVMSAIQTIKQKMPFLLALTSEERRALPQPGDRGRAFIGKALEVATQNPAILPGFFSLDELRKDVELSQTLQPILLSLAQLQGMIEDTARVATSEAYSGALNVYSYAKASGSAAALGGTVEELGKLFARPGATAGGKAPNGSGS